MGCGRPVGRVPAEADCHEPPVSSRQRASARRDRHEFPVQRMMTAGLSSAFMNSGFQRGVRIQDSSDSHRGYPASKGGFMKLLHFSVIPMLLMVFLAVPVFADMGPPPNIIYILADDLGYREKVTVRRRSRLPVWMLWPQRGCALPSIIPGLRSVHLPVAS